MGVVFFTVEQPPLQITISFIDDLPSSFSDVLPDVAPAVIVKGDQMKCTFNSLRFRLFFNILYTIYKIHDKGLAIFKHVKLELRVRMQKPTDPCPFHQSHSSESREYYVQQAVLAF